VVAGQEMMTPGDRRELRAVVRQRMKRQPDPIVLAYAAGYRRGRQEGGPTHA
jgi:hypothetical protein